MKSVLFIIICLFTQNFLFSNSYYFEGDTLFVWADGGLTIRDTASLNGEKLALIPYGSKVVALSSNFETIAKSFSIEIVLEGEYEEPYTNKKAKTPSLEIFGIWSKVEYKGIVGYVYDGYLSRHEAPILGIKSGKEIVSEDLDSYLKRVFGIVSQQERSGKESVVTETYYDHGISRVNIATKVAYVRYVLPNFSMQEIILFYKNGLMSHENKRLITLINKETNPNEAIKSLEFLYYGNGDGSIKVIYTNNIVIIHTYATC
jgi:hypothetical protein